jgi:hypothetical protein
MAGAELQEVLALGVVALVVALALWRRARRRRARPAPGCSGCEAPAAKPKETVPRFYRRKP